jgi:2-polyprenyl-3-methyl-5-hydroxy-6-metoxy-1,4-benzoquinol methylase
VTAPGDAASAGARCTPGGRRLHDDGMSSSWLIKNVIRASQRVPAFQARGAYSVRGKKPDEQERFSRSMIEYEDSASFTEYVSDLDLDGLLREKDVLDYGSGYGGRTVWYGERAKTVEGVEIHASQVDIGNAFAQHRHASNVHFSLGSNDEIKFPNDRFDVIVSFDVLEHVSRPDVMMREFFRVLRPGGSALVIFTPYWGAFSHHLNYITLAPGLHWVFSPDDIVDSVNDLVHEPSFAHLQIPQQPRPSPSYNGSRRCLPMLNGITKPEYERITREAGFVAERIKATPILEKWPVLGSAGTWLNRALLRFPVLDEALSQNLVSVLTKPAPSGARAYS